MTKKKRTIIIGILAVLFILVVPYILLKSLGYQVDIKKFRILATGGIYVKATPQGAAIIIDDHQAETTNILSPTVFAQNLLPGDHTISIKKEGYYDYQKTVPVMEKQVSKLEHVSLIKKDLSFTLLEETADSFYLSPNERQMLVVKNLEQTISFRVINLANREKQDLALSKPGIKVSDVVWSSDSNKVLLSIDGNYFLLEPFLETPKMTSLAYLFKTKDAAFNPQNQDQIFYIKNKNVYVGVQPLPILKNVITYRLNGNTIHYLSYDGFMYTADTTGKSVNKVNTVALKIDAQSAYSVIPGPIPALVKENDMVFLFNKSTGAFEQFYDPAKEVIVSPDGQKILYYNDHEVLYSLSNSANPDKVFLNRFSEKILQAFWLGNDYIIFTLGKSIVISEIDPRGTINMVWLPQTISLINGDQVVIDAPVISFNQQDKKLYMLNQNSLIASERLIP